MIGKLKSNQCKAHNLIYILNEVEHGLGGGVKISGRGKKIGTLYIKNVKIYFPPPLESPHIHPWSLLIYGGKIQIVYFVV